MDPIAQKPAPPQTFSLKSFTSDEPQSAKKDWPHAPVHRLTENGIYIVTAGTLHKEHLFHSPSHRDLIENLLLKEMKNHGWDLEAWAILSNHYHFVARGNPGSTKMGDTLKAFHSISAREINNLDGQLGRTVWHNFRDTRLTYQRAYLTRLNYVHQNAVKHRLVAVANQYPWCSAAWFERTASPAQVKSIYAFKTDRVQVPDDF